MPAPTLIACTTNIRPPKVPAHRRARWRLVVLLLGALGIAGGSMAGETLARVRSSGEVRCGVSRNILGLASQNQQGEWAGFEVDFCRAVAAAILGDPSRVRIIPVNGFERFPALLAERVDLIAGSSTWTFAREGGLRVVFTGPLLFDEQRVLVAQNSPLKALPELAGQVICAIKGSTHVAHLDSYFGARGSHYELRLEESFEAARVAFEAQQCAALSADGVALAALDHPPVGEEDRYRLLPEALGAEPLAPALRQGDAEWERVVRWVGFVLILAEAEGIDQRAALNSLGAGPPAPILVGLRRYAATLGGDPRWAERVIAAGGNYGEIFERNLGGGTRLMFPRGLNRPWRMGGALFAPSLQ